MCMCVCVSASLTAVRTYADLEPRTTRVNRFAHYKLLTPETLHDEECETIFSVKSKRQVERRKERKKEGDIVRKKHLEAPFLISFPLDPFDGMEEDRPSPLRSDYLSLSFSLFLSLSFSHRIDIGSHCIIESLTELSNGHFLSFTKSRATNRLDRNRHTGDTKMNRSNHA